jgi:hypothetical protein
MEGFITFLVVLERVCAFMGAIAITLAISFILLAVKWIREDSIDETRHEK